MMKIAGDLIIDRIVQRLAEENIRAYDSEIVKKIRLLNWQEINQLAAFGDVAEWHNERILKGE